MSVAAGVVTDGQIATFIASIDMTAQLGSSAFFDG
jgi:hypothetical protein